MGKVPRMAETPSSSMGSSRQAKGQQASSMPESETAIRSLKASESVEVAFSAAGFPSAPPDLAALIGSYVKSKTQGIFLSEIAKCHRVAAALARMLPKV